MENLVSAGLVSHNSAKKLTSHTKPLCIRWATCGRALSDAVNAGETSVQMHLIGWHADSMHGKEIWSLIKYFLSCSLLVIKENLFPMKTLLSHEVKFYFTAFPCRAFTPLPGHWLSQNLWEFSSSVEVASVVAIIDIDIRGKLILIVVLPCCMCDLWYTITVLFGCFHIRQKSVIYAGLFR